MLTESHADKVSSQLGPEDIFVASNAHVATYGVALAAHELHDKQPRYDESNELGCSSMNSL